MQDKELVWGDDYKPNIGHNEFEILPGQLTGYLGFNLQERSGLGHIYLNMKFRDVVKAWEDLKKED